jgi:hypothetical protein
MRDKVVGTCGNCGGRVLNYSILHIVGPFPPGICESCGAEEATSGPVLPMKPTRPKPSLDWPNTNISYET